MKENGHRVPHVCENSGDKTRSRTVTRRLDGHSLYNATDVQGRALSQAGRRTLRHRAEQFGRRRGARPSARRPARTDRAPGGVPRGRARPEQSRARDARPAAPARVRAVLRLRRLQRRRAAGARPDPQADARPRSHRRRRAGLAAHPLALRECRRAARVARHGARAGRHGHRGPSAAPAGAGATDHHRRRSHRRSHPTASRSSRSSTATTTHGAICRSWRR